jgi:hypothetical protein
MRLAYSHTHIHTYTGTPSKSWSTFWVCHAGYVHAPSRKPTTHSATPTENRTKISIKIHQMITVMAENTATMVVTVTTVIVKHRKQLCTVWTGAQTQMALHIISHTCRILREARIMWDQTDQVARRMIALQGIYTFTRIINMHVVTVMGTHVSHNTSITTKDRILAICGCTNSSFRMRKIHRNGGIVLLHSENKLIWSGECGMDTLCCSW